MAVFHLQRALCLILSTKGIIIGRMPNIITATVSPFYQNCRVVSDTGSRHSVVVDPGADIEKILSILEENSLTCSAIWLTHSHLDHCGAVARLMRETGAQLIAHRADQFLRARIKADAEYFGLQDSEFENCPEPDRYIDDGDLLSVGRYRFKVMHTPGHSPGHVAFYSEEENLIISGDCIFGGAVGTVGLPGGDAGILLESIQKKILTLGVKTRILCGHGPDTTVGAELKENPFLSLS